MIIGGTNAAGRAGGMRCGFSESYLPCSVNVIRTDIREAVESPSQTGLTYRADARIRNVAGTAWVDLGSASYFQVTRDSAGALDSADLTLQQPEVWSPYLTDYPDLLRPSNRSVQIRAGLVVNGTWYPTVVFIGHIKNYAENLGSSGGAISLRLEDVRDILERTEPAVTAITKASAFRVMLAQQAKVDAVSMVGVTVRLTFKDRELTSFVPAGASYSSVVNAMISQLSGIPLLQISGSGSIKVGQEQTSEELVPAFAYSDSNIFTASRRFDGDNQFNVVRVYGLVDGVGTTGEVEDSADVAKRGRIVYGAGLVGSPTMTYAAAEIEAQEALSNALRGLVDLEIPFNPYLFPGMVISLTSSRLGIATAQVGKVYKMRHQYTVGRCRTYLTGLRTFTP